MKLNNNTIYCFFLGLMSLSIVVRYPSFSHEQGSDSYHMHILADIIIRNGEIGYFDSFISFFGLLPFTYASGQLSLLATLSMLLGLDLEIVVLILGPSTQSMLALRSRLWSNFFTECLNICSSIFFKKK